MGTCDRPACVQFYAMVSFCNPGVLGTPSEFKRKFENPILASREPTASAEAVERGEKVSEELSGLVNNFILRRTNTLLSKFQPPKARPSPPPPPPLCTSWHGCIACMAHR